MNTNFSSYRGHLHNVPDAPRPWPLPKPSMCLHAFQHALAKRQVALNRLQQSSECSSRSVCAFEVTPSGGVAVVEGSGQRKSHTRDECGSKPRDCRKRKREDSYFPEMMIDGNSIKTLDRNRRIECDIDAGVGGVVAIDDDEKCDEMDCEHEGGFTVKPLSTSEKPEDNRENKHVENRFRMGDSEGDEYPVHVENGHRIGRDKEIEKLEAPRTPVAKDAECVKPIERVFTLKQAARLEGFVSASILSPTDSTFETWQAIKKADLEAKLKRVQETKHQLVQMLKEGFYG